MSSPKSHYNRSHRHSGGVSSSVSTPSSSPRSHSSKRKSETLCTICLKETIPILSREKLFTIQHFCSMGCYSKQLLLESSIFEATISNEANSLSSSSPSSTSINPNLSTNVSSESSFRKFGFKSNDINNIIQV
ncbi:hypothetical protein DICPUDRAFT_92102 [Dictyostelium purpureum]|uniref:FLZ-type domain-containing protein n=1 Tax=Dictyostelium purpureum TaxID=5786 RepID=F0ZM10_DICPU|nr:uncharacterized protein DICPUDRAFT_92102 [Dictyostelium purpureum]EGC35020.1 hypothetical protein DICPUDRAFT_92102 [Dictyostelium purpureum]|eukprot:XP_003288448.1 hypothetical protein DICPUDRAFT_92102 [Dictyostelium purpureum]